VSSENPVPVQLPPTQTPHPSQAQATAYQDPEAPKLKRKVRWERISLIAVAALMIAGIGSILYVKLIKNNIEPSAVTDYSGGIANPEVAKSQVTAETEVAKKFLQAVQAKDSATVQELAGEPVKQLVAQQTKDQNATVLSFYQGRFDGIDFNSLISTVSDTDADAATVGKQVIFSDQASTEGSTGTYRIEVMVVTENGALRIATVSTGLKL
jgi:hypothetical protein